MTTDTVTRASAVLERPHFTFNRELEYFTVKELTGQLGCAPHLWPRAVTKELVDNALDGAETAGIAPHVTVLLEPDALEVRDNGIGIPADVITRSLDYLVRVSDKARFVSPSRGQLGNALKVLWAVSFVDTGQPGRSHVWTRGQHHTITIDLDVLAQQPRIHHSVCPADAAIGTRIRLEWPEFASSKQDAAVSRFYRSADICELLETYAAINPHAAFELQYPGSRGDWWPATNTTWQKWRPSDPTSPHWYTTDQLGDLIAAYIVMDRQTGRSRPVRDFIADFRGLSGSAKRKAVSLAAGLERAHLDDLATETGVDQGAVGRLLAAMRAESRPVPPAHLGVLGEPHLRTFLEREFAVAPASIRYKRIAAIHPDGEPYVLETAFGVRDDDGQDGQGALVLGGINWSPSDQRGLPSLSRLLGQARVDAHDPVVFIIHLAKPQPGFGDRAKTQVTLV